MSKVKKVQLDDNTFIFVEATDATDISELTTEAETPYSDEGDEEEETTRSAKGVLDWASQGQQRMQTQYRQTMDTLIQRYTSYTLQAFKEVAFAEVKKVTLEFGIKVDAQTGVPYIASGTAECSVKIVVECSFSE
ncbi:MAG: CU044_2847 family protein [Elainellaceae cyanobacterium]